MSKYLDVLTHELLKVGYIMPDVVWEHNATFLDQFQLPDGVKAIIMKPRKDIMEECVRQGLSFFDGDLEFMAMLVPAAFIRGYLRAALFGDCHHYMGELVLTQSRNLSWIMWHKNYRLQYVNKGNVLTPSLQVISYEETKS